MDRREFLSRTALLASGALLPGCGTLADPPTSPMRRLPAETAPHTRTWMAFGAQRQIWGRRLLPEVQKNLALVAQTIAEFEPVTMLVNEKDLSFARSMVGEKIELVSCPLDDIWMRDMGPVFVEENGALAGIDFHFNGWGGKQEHAHDAKVARFTIDRAGAPVIASPLVLEGGCLEVDGEGTAIITESSVVNENRNPGKSRASCETELKSLLGLEKIIWLPGISGKEITDGHTDFYARFPRPGVVVAAMDSDPESFDHAVTQHHLEILQSATDARGRRLTVETIEAPRSIRSRFRSRDFAAGYINYSLVNGGVVIPEFGDAHADQTAREKLEALFPDRTVVAIAIDGIAAGGGGIHCTTQQEPRTS